MPTERREAFGGVSAVATRILGAHRVSAARQLRRDTAAVLMYHNIVPNAAAAPSEESFGHLRHLPQSVFAAHLDTLTRTHDVVPLAEILGGAGRHLARPRVAITFDGGYSGAVRAGVEELRARRLPATIFVATEMLGGRAHWWDVVHGAARATDFERRATELAGGAEGRVRALAADCGLELRCVPPHARTATDDDLDAAAEFECLSFGTHGTGYVDLVGLSVMELALQLRHSLRWLRNRFARAVPYLALPYGRTSPLVAGMAREVGYVGGLLTGGGVMSECAKRAAEGRFLVPRVSVPAHLSPNELMLRISGAAAG